MSYLLLLESTNVEDELTISAKSIEWYEEPGKLSKIPIDESKIAEDQRIPRLTSAVW